VPSKRPTVELTVNDQTIEAFEGESVMAAARRAGIEIPGLCYLEGLSVVGQCRLCMVEIAEVPGMVPACATIARADMNVSTDTAKLRHHRKVILEMLFAEGNHVCAVCVANTHCELQDTAVACGMDHVRLDYQSPKRGVDASHPRYVYDANRCILCTRCVRTCDEIEGAHVWDVAGRGSESELVTGLGIPWGEFKACTQCGKCVWVCPTGALSEHGSTVAGAQGHPEVITWLVAARRDHEWLQPQEDA